MWAHSSLLLALLQQDFLVNRGKEFNTLKWEYKTLSRTRSWVTTFGGLKTTPWNETITNMLPQLGIEGWELVAIVPGSGNAGEHVAGFTNEELWVFKRPLVE